MNDGNGTRTTQPALFNTARVAELHHQLGVLIAAASYAVDQLGPLTEKNARAARAMAVLRDALAEVTT